MKILLSSLLLASLCARSVLSFPTGAPATACDTLTPNPIGHMGPPQNSSVPYWIDLSAFNQSGVWQYTPGQTYTLTLSGNNGEIFRGFFVQARLVADDTSQTGAFVVVDSDNSKLSACTPSNEVGITHTAATNKTSVNFSWTAPASGTGAIRFAFAVVQVQVTYWADERSDMMIAEGPPAVVPPTGGAEHLVGFSFWTILSIALVVMLKKAF